MTNSTISQNKWWLSVIIGVLFIVLGIWSLMTPVATFLTIAYFIGFMFLFTGVAEIFSVSSQNPNWGWSLLSGVLDFIIGILFLTMPPGEVMLVTTFLFGFWILFRSMLGLGLVLSLKNSTDHPKSDQWKSIIALPIIGIVLGFIFLLSPVIAGGIIVGIFSASIIAFGVFEIYWGFFLKKSSV
ncbi:DUF308 domain-containing protein [Wohlfahrtiimonas chitiniclastica]|uniref:Acid-resistance membrane protein n=2 Tax=Wohlfahrtiimonas chitiniclastica TaxID=400946 RepID=L8XYP4_9GAMM|nr:DUF308 domain-containing protein [Wohlfahrtiimonas chitiniclastica]ELV09017.1 Hypothetical protein F387_00909 [Wohlfahrtiimonas chitiniclastica SH04]KZS24070.1 hypothetical protein BMY_1953 [Wohlfahrtiimonas chitiniclastica]MBS7817245.1 DUF308 domain-containing protein [Wohlfahrtiimonas chitiniclastica]MBS7820614.1 DUF308 domain-containing protein [Wohlfahrtiimonas chitiniclastica]MBS7822900.1 DUF308 domain-containing protein [Wohlfahrtiimonas chitiniclastica]